MLGDVDAGLAAIEGYIRRLVAAEHGLFGKKGQNDSMDILLAAMGACFDWPRLVKDVPTPHDVQQFGVLAHGLRPFLRHTLWPAEHDFPGVLGPCVYRPACSPASGPPACALPQGV